jgi:hypothetical protein
MSERVIGGKRCEVQKLPTRRRFEYLGRIQQIRRTTGFESPLDLPADVRDGLLETSMVDSKPLLPVVDELFDVPDLIELVGFAMEVNFAGFFSVRPGKGKAEPAVAAPVVSSEG